MCTRRRGECTLEIVLLPLRFRNRTNNKNNVIIKLRQVVVQFVIAAENTNKRQRQTDECVFGVRASSAKMKLNCNYVYTCGTRKYMRSNSFARVCKYKFAALRMFRVAHFTSHSMLADVDQLLSLNFDWAFFVRIFSLSLLSIALSTA